jgi:hypothetical protein
MTLTLITLINVNIMFYQNLNNVFITSETGSMNSIMNVTIIVKQNLYNICMTIKTGIVYWCCIKLKTTDFIMYSKIYRYVINCIKENSSHFCQSIKALFKSYFTISGHYICLQSMGVNY